MAIVFVQYEAKPEKASALSDEWAGALISAWVNAKNVKQAKEFFTNELMGSGWKLIQFEDAYVVDSSRCSDEELEYYTCARDDDDVYLIDAWPLDTEGNNEIDPQSY